MIALHVLHRRSLSEVEDAEPATIGSRKRRPEPCNALGAAKLVSLESHSLLQTTGTRRGSTGAEGLSPGSEQRRAAKASTMVYLCIDVI